MARQTHTPLAALGPFNAYAANAADLAMTAADAANKEQVALAGNGVLVIAHNTGLSARTITFTSVADPYLRTGDIATYSLGAGEYAAFGPFHPVGWQQSDGKLYFEAAHADVKFGVVTL